MPTQKLPSYFYTAADAAKIDRHVIEQKGVSGYCLMGRAAQAAYDLVCDRFPETRSLVVLAGAGNNAGDGYALAQIAHQAGWRVTVLALVAPDTLKNEAGQAVADCLAAGVLCLDFAACEALPAADLYVDALFGIGLSRPIEASDFTRAIQYLNATAAPVLSLDVPSGLAADTGQPLGLAVKAQITITFIVVKQGLLTAQGPDFVGELWFDDLAISADCAARLCSGVSHVNLQYLPQIPSRAKASHKGSFGDVLVVGGDVGMAGAALLAAEAAISGGAGRVTLMTHPEHLTAALIRCPEVLTAAVDEGVDAAEVKSLLAPLLAKASVVVLGPGLGQRDWGMVLAQTVISAACEHKDLNLVLDADALNLIAADKIRWPIFSRVGTDKYNGLGARTIMTPHPLEAARLLDSEAATSAANGGKTHHNARTIQTDRFAAAAALADLFDAHILLKGAGTVLAHSLLYGDQRHDERVQKKSRLALCSLGNPGMAVAGMGDVLSGLLGALFGQLSSQGLSTAEVVAAGAVIHAAAGDWVWAQGDCASVRPTAMMSAIGRVLGGLYCNRK